MMQSGFLLQILMGTWVTLKVAGCAALLGLCIGLTCAICESFGNRWLRYLVFGFIFLIRGLPELLVLFFVYFGVAALLSNFFNHYVEINPFAASVIALGLIFGAYASQVFRGAFLAIDEGQLEVGIAMGLSRTQLICRILLPQTWRYALPGIGNIWLVLIKDTSIVMLIGLSDLMSKAKIIATSTQAPFTVYLSVAIVYLFITSISQIFLKTLTMQNKAMQP